MTNSHARGTVEVNPRVLGPSGPPWQGPRPHQTTGRHTAVVQTSIDHSHPGPFPVRAAARWHSVTTRAVLLCCGAARRPATARLPARVQGPRSPEICMTTPGLAEHMLGGLERTLKRAYESSEGYPAGRWCIPLTLSPTAAPLSMPLDAGQQGREPLTNLRPGVPLIDPYVNIKSIASCCGPHRVV
ncbi:hypothetical protein CKAH01_10945 [Colletotrichum kahawae]|uniref:Uncharacterized protein n=1 Tax=Colletotrichum kahawae TaxID=34407 RepID=A0AAD9XXS4_COLKA|nr:hypothetical protein CKAH01_10945 [Colletotrichum kahawae]